MMLWLVPVLVIRNLPACMLSWIPQMLLSRYLSLITFHHLVMAPLLRELGLSLSLEGLHICHLIVGWLAICKVLQAGTITRVSIVEVRDRVTVRIRRHFNSIARWCSCPHHLRGRLSMEQLLDEGEGGQCSLATVTIQVELAFILDSR